jgi:imidazolonepropionase-like amidohydrolase
MRKWIIRAFIALVVAVLLAIGAFWLLFVYPRRNSHPPLRLAHGTLAIEHARIYTSPTDAPIDDGTVLIRDGLIAAVGANVSVPADATLIPCDDCIVTAGFWNVHVHFTEPKWSGAEWQPAAKLNAQLADMFLSRGFTTVVDLGSNPADTFAIRRRIELGELAGPYIYSSGPPLYPPQGVPFYVRDAAPKWLLFLMQQPETPQEAQRMVHNNLHSGADVTKLFTGSWVAHGRVKPMPLEIAKAAVETSHLNGCIVFAHPSNLEGSRVAMESGVDVLAHAPDETRGITPDLFAGMVHKNMAMSPTLKMFATTVTTDPAYLNPIYAEVRTFHSFGGTLLFGTDVGYMTDYSTEGEFEGLARSGLNWQDVLAMLTANPVARLGQADKKGSIAPGKLADLTILSSDPAADLTNFSRVQAVVRSGAVVWQRKP